MIFTLQDGINAVQKFVDAGSNNNTRTIERINEAIQYLIDIADWKLLIRRARLFTCNGCVGLPREIEKIIQVDIDGYPANVWSRSYEFLEGGPGDLSCCNNTCSPDLADLGQYYPTLNTIKSDKDYQLLAMSTHADDTSLTINVRGINEVNDQLMVNGIPGIEIPINRWSEGVEGQILNQHTLSLNDTEFKRIDSVIKPVTKGYITLYAYDPDAAASSTTVCDPMLQFLAKYHPDETQPGYRRYKITDPGCCGTSILALVKLAYVPAKHLNDVLLIQSLPALKAMIQGISKYDVNDMNAGLQYEAQAISLLQRQLSNSEQDSNEITVQSSYNLGAVKAVI